ncbi:hypothetical protein TrRE_jg11029 [Triparma retinervis]|uniref:Uncharacterized protein n=1 Tax=Triparma retinervis TaxID=2557542 RepID=A0A9W7CCY1_9STRA|nr:hypothetical protein TrRE_jg11029 [Triparma retinervis]
MTTKYDDLLDKTVLVVLLRPSCANMDPKALKEMSKALLPKAKRMRGFEGLAKFHYDTDNPNNLAMSMVKNNRWKRVEDIDEFQVVTIHLKHPTSPHTYHVATLFRNVLPSKAKNGILAELQEIHRIPQDCNASPSDLKNVTWCKGCGASGPTNLQQVQRNLQKVNDPTSSNMYRQSLRGAGVVTQHHNEIKAIDKNRIIYNTTKPKRKRLRSLMSSKPKKIMNQEGVLIDPLGASTSSFQYGSPIHRRVEKDNNRGVRRRYGTSRGGGNGNNRSMEHEGMLMAYRYLRKIAIYAEVQFGRRNYVLDSDGGKSVTLNPNKNEHDHLVYHKEKRAYHYDVDKPNWGGAVSHNSTVADEEEKAVGGKGGNHEVDDHRFEVFPNYAANIQHASTAGTQSSLACHCDAKQIHPNAIVTAMNNLDINTFNGEDMGPSKGGTLFFPSLGFGLDYNDGDVTVMRGDVYHAVGHVSKKEEGCKKKCVRGSFLLLSRKPAKHGNFEATKME